MNSANGHVSELRNELSARHATIDFDNDCAKESGRLRRNSGTGINIAAWTC